MKLVVGLGNPGEKYRGTRHNVGFEVIDRLAARGGVGFETAPVEALQAKWRRPDEGVLLVKPMTFMNLSGAAVAGLARFYKVETADLLIVCDDVNLPLGRLRARATGTRRRPQRVAIDCRVVGTIDYARLRIGVGRGE